MQNIAVRFMALTFGKYTDVCHSMCKKGECQIKDTKTVPDGLQFRKLTSDSEKIVEDKVALARRQYEGSVRRLYEGSYIMGPTNVKCLIYKCNQKKKSLEDELSLKEKQDKEPAQETKKRANRDYTSFSCLKNFRHAAVITLLNFYDQAGQGRVVLSWVDCMLLDFAKSGNKMFSANHQNLSPLFRAMLIDISHGLEELFKLNLYPQKISLRDLYVCKATRTVKLLVLEVDQMQGEDSLNRRNMLWANVKDIIFQTYSLTADDVTDYTYANDVVTFDTSGDQNKYLSDITNRFIRYIDRDATLLSNYPDSWSYDLKERYVLLLVSAKRTTISSGLVGSELRWPVENGVTPTVLNDLIHDESQRQNPYPYSKANPYDYLKLCRTVLKHFNAICLRVARLRNGCRNTEDFIKKMERWEPLIWCILYDAVGWPES